jgi:hypothetical protein
MAQEAHLQYFLGEVTTGPSVAYYIVVTPLRVTPWLLLAAVVASVAVWLDRSVRGFGIALTATAAPAMLIISLATKKLDRYALPLIAVAIVLVGVTAAAAVHRWGPRLSGQGRRLATAAAAVVAVAVFVNSLVVSPWSLAYFNPLLGGSDRARRTTLVGWGEGMERAGLVIADLEGGDCDDVTVTGYLFLGAQARCGHPPEEGELAKYVIVPVAARQVLPQLQNHLTVDRALVGEVRIRGLTYVEIYGPRPGWPDETRV